MTQVTIDNKEVSIQLGNNEQTTVPSGEIWDVTINNSAMGKDANNSGSCAVSINGVAVLSVTSTGNHQGQSANVVLTGGDSINVVSSHSSQGANISGYEVSQ